LRLDEVCPKEQLKNITNNSISFIQNSRKGFTLADGTDFYRTVGSADEWVMFGF